MGIKEMKFTELSKKVKKENLDGIVLLGTGGDLSEWVEGVTGSLQEEGVLPEGEVGELWGGVYLLETTGGRNDLVMMFRDGVKYDMGVMALWRLRFGDCSWVSDYIVNYKHQYE